MARRDRAVAMRTRAHARVPPDRRCARPVRRRSLEPALVHCRPHPRGSRTTRAAGAGARAAALALALALTLARCARRGCRLGSSARSGARGCRPSRATYSCPSSPSRRTYATAHRCEARQMCPQFFYPKFHTSGHHTVYGILRATGMAGPTLPKARAPRPCHTSTVRSRGERGGGWIELERAPRARAAGANGRSHRAHPSEGHAIERPPVLPGVADAGSKPHAAARVGTRGPGRDGAARGRLARESGLEPPIDLRGAGWWAATERCVGAGAEGWGWEGCGRPTERDARDHALGRRRRKRPLADLAAQASGVSAHACCHARVIISAG